MKIKRSYARKVQEEHIGGNKYETSDHCCEIEEEFEDKGEKSIQEKSAYLDALCRAEVGKSIGIRTKELKVIVMDTSEGDEEGVPFL